MLTPAKGTSGCVVMITTTVWPGAIVALTDALRDVASGVRRERRWHL